MATAHAADGPAPTALPQPTSELSAAAGASGHFWGANAPTAVYNSRPLGLARQRTRASSSSADAALPQQTARKRIRQRVNPGPNLGENPYASRFTNTDTDDPQPADNASPIVTFQHKRRAALRGASESFRETVVAYIKENRQLPTTYAGHFMTTLNAYESSQASLTASDYLEHPRLRGTLRKALESGFGDETRGYDEGLQKAAQQYMTTIRDNTHPYDGSVCRF